MHQDKPEDLKFIFKNNNQIQSGYLLPSNTMLFMDSMQLVCGHNGHIETALVLNSGK